jgi:hypothetical protein
MTSRSRPIACSNALRFGVTSILRHIRPCDLLGVLIRGHVVSLVGSSPSASMIVAQQSGLFELGFGTVAVTRLA